MAGPQYALEQKVLDYLLEKAQLGYEDAILKAFAKYNLDDSNNSSLANIKNIFSDTGYRDSIIHSDNAIVQAEIEAKLREYQTQLKLDYKNNYSDVDSSLTDIDSSTSDIDTFAEEIEFKKYHQKRINVILSLLELLYKKNLPSAAHLELHARKIWAELSSEMPLPEEFTRVIKNYSAAADNLYAWCLNHADENGKISEGSTQDKQQIEKLQHAFKNYYATIAWFMQTQRQKTTAHLLALTKGDLSNAGKKVILLRILGVIDLFSGKLEQNTLNKKLADVKAGSVNENLINTQFERDNPRNGGSTLLLCRSGRVINSSRDFDIRTMDYELCLMQEDGVIAKNKVYVKILDGELYYTVITPSGKQVTEQISKEELKYEFTNPLTLEQLQETSVILNVALARGHLAYNPNKVAMISTLLAQSFLADLEEFKNNFIPGDLDFTGANFQAYETLVDITDENIWPVKIGARTEMLRHSIYEDTSGSIGPETKYVRQPPVIYTGIEFDVKVSKDEKAQTIFTPDAEGSKCNALVVGQLDKELSIKVKKDIIKFQALPLGAIDRVSRYNAEFMIFLSPVFDEDILRHSSIGGLFNMYGADLKSRYSTEEATLAEEEFQFIAAFVKRCSSGRQENFILEGAKLFEFAKKRLATDKSTARADHYKKLIEYARKIIMIDFDLLKEIDTRGNALLSHAMSVYQKNGDLLAISSEMQNSDIFLAEHLKFGMELLASISDRPDTPSREILIKKFNKCFNQMIDYLPLKKTLSIYKRNTDLLSARPEIRNSDIFLALHFDFGKKLLASINNHPEKDSREKFIEMFNRSFNLTLDNLPLEKTLAYCNSINSSVLDFIQSAIDNVERKNEICKLLSAMAQRVDTAAASTLRKILRKQSPASAQVSENQDKKTIPTAHQHNGTILTAQLLVNKAIINDSRVTGTVLVEMLKEQPELAREAVRPSFWQDLLGTNISRKFSAGDIKQLIRDHGADVFDGIFAKTIRFMGSSLMRKLTGEDVAEILFEIVLNKNKELLRVLRALPNNSDIADKLVSIKDRALKARVYLALITHDYNFTTNVLMKSKRFARDFQKIVPEHSNVDIILYYSSIKDHIKLKGYLESLSPLNKICTANILLSRYHADGKTRILFNNKEFPNTDIRALLREHIKKNADPLLLNGYFDLDIEKPIQEIQTFNDQIKTLLECDFTEDNVRQIEMLLGFIENDIVQAEEILKSKVDYMVAVRKHRDHLSSSKVKDLVSEILLIKLTGELENQQNNLAKLRPRMVLDNAYKQLQEYKARLIKESPPTTPRNQRSCCSLDEMTITPLASPVYVH